MANEDLTCLLCEPQIIVLKVSKLLPIYASIFFECVFSPDVHKETPKIKKHMAEIEKFVLITAKQQQNVDVPEVSALLRRLKVMANRSIRFVWSDEEIPQINTKNKHSVTPPCILHCVSQI